MVQSKLHQQQCITYQHSLSHSPNSLLLQHCLFADTCWQCVGVLNSLCLMLHEQWKMFQSHSPWQSPQLKTHSPSNEENQSHHWPLPKIRPVQRTGIDKSYLRKYDLAPGLCNFRHIIYRQSDDIPQLDERGLLHKEKNTQLVLDIFPCTYIKFPPPPYAKVSA